MPQEEKTNLDNQETEKHAQPAPANKHISDHMANERTFLAWVRTGLATIAFGFVVARFGLFLQELGIKTKALVASPYHFSSIIGIALVLLGVGLIATALGNFLHVRRAIDAEQFHPMSVFAWVLTVLASGIGLLLAVYLLFTVY